MGGIWREGPPSPCLCISGFLGRDCNGINMRAEIQWSTGRLVEWLFGRGDPPEVDHSTTDSGRVVG